MDNILLSPFQIGGMWLKNRIIVPAMGTAFADSEGFVTQRQINYYAERARGGAGLVIVGVAYVHLSGKYFKHQVGISENKFVPGLKRLVDTVHRNGSKIAVQLHHAGRLANSIFTGMPPVAPSSIPYKGGSKAGAKGNIQGEIPKALNVAEIQQIQKYFVDAAVRAEGCGFDAVELHGAHGYLIDQFLSRSSNVRKDIYGGSTFNRARCLCEILKMIKNTLGAKFPVWCRINAKEYGMPNATTPEDALQTALLVESAGSDAISLSATGPNAPIFTTSPNFSPAVLGEIVKPIKAGINLPVILAGKITVEAGETLLKGGTVDIVAIGRGHICDPMIVRKLASFRAEDIAPCILCMKCLDRVLDIFADEDAGIVCSVNAAIGKEAELKIRVAQKPGRVLVIGGGPGGLEAARVSALRGHQVTLWDSGIELGGQMIWAGRAPHKDRIEVFRQYLIRQVIQLGVQVKTEMEATADRILSFSPDGLVLAVGGVAFAPDIPGLDEIDSFQSLEFFRGEAKPGEKVLVIGGGLVGCEVAEMLAEEGRQVTLIDVLPEIACTLGPSLRCACIDRLESKKVRMIPNVQIHRIEKGRAFLRGSPESEETAAFDSVVLATGFRPNRRLYQQLVSELPNVHLVGDCAEPRTIREAVAEGYRAGLEI